MKKWFCFLALLTSCLGYSQEFSLNALQTPPMESRPWCYYWILKGNVTESQITHDLEAMAEKGFGGILLFDSRYYYDAFDSKEHLPVPLHIKHIFMSEEWQNLMMHLLREADRLGMQVSLNIADSGGMLRGPWDMKELGPKEVVWTEENVNGPQAITLELPKAPTDFAFYSDTNLVAARLKTGAVKDRENVKMGSSWYGIRELSPSSLEVTDVVDLKPFVKDGKLTWNVPDGEWKILRFGYKVVGDFGSVDILSEKAVSRYFRLFAEPLIQKAGPLVGKTLTHFYNVSWEGSNPNWTTGFEQEFQSRNEYSLVKFLPVLCGFVVESPAVSERFLTDYYRTVSWCFQEHCYANIGRLCHQQGIVWHSEDGGPWRRTAPIFRESDMLTFWGQNDVAQGEFWVNTGDATKTRSNMRFAAMAANLYGQREVACEAFTHMTTHWTMYPAWLKPAADRNFIDGMNMIIWHTFTASPPDQGLPGLEYFAGTHVNTNVTWFPYLEGFLHYLGRCQYLLRQGTFVADVAAYVSDRNYVGWGHGEKWNEKSSLVLPKGMVFDWLDTPSLLRMEYRNGKLVLPSGMTYRILVVDPQEEALPVEALRKIESLQKAGAKIVFGQKRPLHDRGLKHYPHGDAEIQEIVARIWKPSDTFPMEGLLPDFEGDFQYHHRSANGVEIYFLAGSGESLCTFRHGSAEGLCCDAVSGEVRKIALKPTSDGRFQTTIALPVHGSAFLVFGSTEKPNVSKKKTSTETFLQLDAPWTVRFDTRWGAPASVVWEKLLDWTQHSEETIRYYSGTATYAQSFTIPELPTTPVFLNLGKVHHIARVRLNGKDLGVVWTAPWEIDLSPALQKGENQLQIEVANVWANRLIGDAHLPPEKRFTRSNMFFYEKPGDIPEGGKRKFMRWQGFHKEDVPLPSGLLGPVELKR